jgi:hypothetical protein
MLELPLLLKPVPTGLNWFQGWTELIPRNSFLVHLLSLTLFTFSGVSYQPIVQTDVRHQQASCRSCCLSTRTETLRYPQIQQTDNLSPKQSYKANKTIEKFFSKINGRGVYEQDEDLF